MPSDKTQALKKSMNTNICIVGTLKPLEEVAIVKLNFQKYEVVSGKSLFFMIGSFCTPHSICLNIGF